MYIFINANQSVILYSDHNIMISASRFILKCQRIVMKLQTSIPQKIWKIDENFYNFVFSEIERSKMEIVTQIHPIKIIIVLFYGVSDSNTVCTLCSKSCYIETSYTQLAKLQEKTLYSTHQAVSLQQFSVIQSIQWQFCRFCVFECKIPYLILPPLYFNFVLKFKNFLISIKITLYVLIINKNNTSKNVNPMPLFFPCVFW